MSTLVNAISTVAPHVDERLRGKIVICASCIIPDAICTAMTEVIKAVADQLEKENRAFGDGLAITCIFIPETEFAIKLDKEQIAICIKLAVYPMAKLCQFIGDKRLYMILAEELCHLIWDISDETLINYKVIEVLEKIFPDIEMQDVYSV